MTRPDVCCVVHVCVRVCFKQMGDTEAQAVKWLAPQATGNGNWDLSKSCISKVPSPFFPSPLFFSFPPPLLPTRQPLNAYSKNFEEEKYHLPRAEYGKVEPAGWPPPLETSQESIFLASGSDFRNLSALCPRARKMTRCQFACTNLTEDQV